jgi:hypothetical protein
LVDALAEACHVRAPLELLEAAVHDLGHEEAGGVGADVDDRDPDARNDSKLQGGSSPSKPFLIGRLPYANIRSCWWYAS